MNIEGMPATKNDRVDTLAWTKYLSEALGITGKNAQETLKNAIANIQLASSEITKEAGTDRLNELLAANALYHHINGAYKSALEDFATELGRPVYVATLESYVATTLLPNKVYEVTWLFDHRFFFEERGFKPEKQINFVLSSFEYPGGTGTLNYYDGSYTKYIKEIDLPYGRDKGIGSLRDMITKYGYGPILIPNVDYCNVKLRLKERASERAK